MAKGKNRRGSAGGKAPVVPTDSKKKAAGKKGALHHIKGEGLPDGALPPVPEDLGDWSAEVHDTYGRKIKCEAELEGYRGKVKTTRERVRQIQRELDHLLSGQRALPFGGALEPAKLFDVCDPEGNVLATHPEGDPRLADAKKNKKLVVREHVETKKGKGRVAGDLANAIDKAVDAVLEPHLARGPFASNNKRGKGAPAKPTGLSNKDKAAGERDDPDDDDDEGDAPPTIRHGERVDDFGVRLRAWRARNPDQAELIP